MAQITLADYVKAQPSAFVTDCETQAKELVAHKIGTSTVPDAIVERAILEVGADLYNRRAARNGIAQFDVPDIAPMRIRNNPIDAAIAMLAPYLGVGIA